MRRTVLFLATILAAGPALAQDKAGTPKAAAPKPGEAVIGTSPRDPEPAEPVTVPMPEDPEVVPNTLQPSAQPDAKASTGKPAADPKK